MRPFTRVPLAAVTGATIAVATFPPVLVAGRIRKAGTLILL
ncbi:MAG TPA: hypothetical protein VJA46_02225 [Acidimicrobiia bacterium]|nr:hypothetical protein [Acidimicrobiia bacterium]